MPVIFEPSMMSLAENTEAGPPTVGVPLRPEPAGTAVVSKLLLWMSLWILIQTVSWGSGIPRVRLESAIEQGAAEVERRTIGEVDDDEIREAIATQRATFPFFRALMFLGDFVCGPLGLAIRCFAAAVLFSGLAAMAGRMVGFAQALDQNAGAQGYWVAGLAVQTLLTISLRRAEVETSATLLLPSAATSTTTWMILRQLDAFALIGWISLARGAWSRGQTSILGAGVGMLLLWAIEASLRSSVGLLLGAWMRLSLIPENFG